MVTYSPRLNAAELRTAAEALNEAASLAHIRARDIHRASTALTATGYSGKAAQLSLSLFPLLSGNITTSASLFEHGANILNSAATMQEKLDQLAYVAIFWQRAEVVSWLNLMSTLLDSHTAQALRGLVGDEEDASQRLADYPFDTLKTIDSHLAPTVAASTVDTVRGSDGLIIEVGPGGTTVIIGDVVNPARITTMVAGVSTGRPEGLAGELAKARTIAATTGGAVVVWQGYVPPRNVPSGIDPVAARVGGANLASFQAALNQRYPQAQQTVLAHSYGTVVASRAAEEHGLHVDDLWLLGSPGVGVSSVEQLELIGAKPRVFVADAHADPIALTRFRDDAAHGYSPSFDSFGATRVEGIRGDHGAYFSDPILLTALAQAAQPQLAQTPAPVPAR